MPRPDRITRARGGLGLGLGVALALAALSKVGCGGEPAGDAASVPAVHGADSGDAGSSDGGGPASDAGDAPDAQPEASADAAPPPGPLAFVLAGERNSGGIALNSGGTPGEVALRPALQIMNLYSGTFAFEDLDIGFNNLVDHAGLSNVATYVPTPPNVILVHGMELGLANAVEAGAFAGQSQVYLIKTGQGGSRIAEWAVGGAYWSKFLQRTTAGKAALPGNTRWIVWYSQGINDAIAATPMDTWKIATVAHLQKIRAELPGCRIVMTEFQSRVLCYDTACSRVEPSSSLSCRHSASPARARQGRSSARRAILQRSTAGHETRGGPPRRRCPSASPAARSVTTRMPRAETPRSRPSAGSSRGSFATWLGATRPIPSSAGTRTWTMPWTSSSRPSTPITMAA
jgi:hypothetical protein